MKIRSLVASATLLLAAQIQALPVTPTFGTFGDLAGATFGGSGIPTDPTAISTIVVGTDTITLGLTAHQRFANPALTNDGAGTFYAGAGANDGTPGNPGTAATWNFAYYIDIAGGGTFADYQFSLLYDFDPGVDTDAGQLGALDLNSAIVALGGTLSDFDELQGSENATFGYLANGALPFITAPAFASFDPNQGGQYSFALIASSAAGTAAPVELGRSAINVEVTAVPEPTSLALLGLALVGARRLGSRPA